MLNIPSKALRHGLAVGGPLAGEVLTTDYPKGIVVVDKVRGHAWIYDYDYSEQKFIARSDTPAALNFDTSETYNIRRAAEENNYEVRSHPRAGEDY